MKASVAKKRDECPLWSDIFDYTGRPDSAKWAFETRVWRNREEQVYTDRLRNARVEDGILVIEAHREEIRCPVEKGRVGNYSSASLISRQAWRYGRVEVTAKLPRGRGLWPAIWMMPERRSDPWPACGEIDIMENVGWDAHTIHASVHTAAYNHVARTHRTGTMHLENPWTSFHLYAVDWNAERMLFSIDGEPVFTHDDRSLGSDSWPFDQPFHLKLNVAVGGGWGAVEGIDESVFPQRMQVKSVRVFAP